MLTASKPCLLLASCFLVQGVAYSQDPSSTQEIIAQVRESVVIIRVEGRDGEEVGLGTGFVIDPKGIIASNFHVIEEGRRFRIETADGKELPVTSVHASDVTNDLVLIRVAAPEDSLKALTLAKPHAADQGMPVLAFGNPLGLRNSVVQGIVSAKRDIDGREMIQLAMPIEQGNSGGPLVDQRGHVHGIINMKSAIDDNLAFAIPIDRLLTLIRQPNPVSIQRWAGKDNLDPSTWNTPLGGGWKQRGGRILAPEQGKSFGGRALCLWQTETPEVPFEIGVNVKLDNEAGAAGLVFHCDGGDKHYGFYPSGGRLRFSAFLGPTVYSWQVLQEVESAAYLPGQWNRLRVRVEPASVKCYVNETLVIESPISKLNSGLVGLAKFRQTKPEFRQFEIGDSVSVPTISESANQWLEKLEIPEFDAAVLESTAIDELGSSGELSAQQILRQARVLEERATQLKQLAADVQRVATLKELEAALQKDSENQLLDCALLIAKLDQPDLDVDSYSAKVEAMADEVRELLPNNPADQETRDALHRYLFEENGYHGSRSEYYHPANSHLNRVIDDREGLPITLAILYMEIGRRLGLKLEGVGLPGHFVVRLIIEAATPEKGRPPTEENNNLAQETEEARAPAADAQLIDVFEKGSLLTEQAARRLIAANARRLAHEDDFRPQSNQAILVRVLNNLLGIASRNQDPEAMLRYCDAMLILDPDTTQTRMLRAQLRGMTGRISQAESDLRWLLDQQPADLDRPLVERMLEALKP